MRQILKVLFLAWLVSVGIAPSLRAQEAATEFLELIETWGIPAAVVRFDTVEREGDALVARNTVVVVGEGEATATMLFPELLLGTVTISDVVRGDGYLAHYRLQLTDIVIDLIAMRERLARMAAPLAAGETRTLPPAATRILAGKLVETITEMIERGYAQIGISASLRYAYDAEDGTLAGAFTVHVSDTASIALTFAMSSVSEQAMRDQAARTRDSMHIFASGDLLGLLTANASQQPTADMLEMKYETFKIELTDKGIFDRLGAEMEAIRLGLTGGVAGGPLVDAAIAPQVSQWSLILARPRESIEPNIREVAEFILDPGAITVAAKISPAISLGEMAALDPNSGAAKIPPEAILKHIQGLAARVTVTVERSPAP